MSSLGRCCLASLIAFSFCACSPKYPPPPGFVNACYGGDARRLDGETPKFTMQIRATQAEWPKVADRFKAFGLTHNLSYFDTSVTDLVGLRMINIHLCSPKGIWLSADKRLWENGPKDLDPNLLPISLYIYDATADWRTVAQQFQESFRDWPGGLKSQWRGAEVVAPNTSLERTRGR
jgi:hypothetical protein